MENITVPLIIAFVATYIVCEVIKYVILFLFDFYQKKKKQAQLQFKMNENGEEEEENHFLINQEQLQMPQNISDPPVCLDLKQKYSDQNSGFLRLYEEIKNFNSQSIKQLPFFPPEQDEKKMISKLFEEMKQFVITITEKKAKQIIDEQFPQNQNKIRPISQQQNLNILPSNQINCVLKNSPNFEIQQDDQRTKRVQDIIYSLYQSSSNKSNVEPKLRPFVREECDEREFLNNYGILSSDVKNELIQICNKMMYARGDGNCFYTSLGYQYLLIILTKFDDKQFYNFLNKTLQSNLAMIIKIDQYCLDDLKDQKYLLQEFLYRLQELRHKPIETRAKEFQIHFAAYEQQDQVIDGCFYGLSTIFFRNLAYRAIDKSEMVDAFVDRLNILIWEEMCNSNEIVIQSLAKDLNMHIQLLFFDKQSFQLQEYEEHNQYKIILLIRHGHYNIGILQKKENLELLF